MMMHDVHMDRLRLRCNNQYKCHSMNRACKKTKLFKLQSLIFMLLPLSLTPYTLMKEDFFKNDVENLHSTMVFIKMMLKSYIQRRFSKNWCWDLALICKNATVFTSTMFFYKPMLLQHCRKIFFSSSVSVVTIKEES